VKAGSHDGIGRAATDMMAVLWSVAQGVRLAGEDGAFLNWQPAYQTAIAVIRNALAAGVPPPPNVAGMLEPARLAQRRTRSLRTDAEDLLRAGLSPQEVARCCAMPEADARALHAQLRRQPSGSRRAGP
jgi:hypothetical protein